MSKMSKELSKDLSRNLPESLQSKLEKVDISIDLSGLERDHPFVHDMSAEEVATAFVLHYTGCLMTTSKILDVEKIVIDSNRRKRGVQRLLAILKRADLITFGVQKAYHTLMDIMDDDGESANARIKASETILKWSGEMDGKNASDLKGGDLSEMSAEDLEGMIEKLEGQKASLSK